MIAFFLVDGVGLGARDPGRNPLARTRTLLSQFADGSGEPLPAGGVVGAADANLGVPGRPQSATGHTTLLTGVNAPAVLGKHLLGFPNEKLRGVIAQRNLFLDLRRLGREGTYANAYRCAYLDALGLRHEHASLPEPALPVPASRLRPSASTAAVAATDAAFRTFDHLRAGAALYHDITNEQPRAVGCDLPRRAPGEAAEILLDLGGGADVVMFEFFRTDEAGHDQDFDAAERALVELDELLRKVVEGLRDGDGVLMTSDHGNVEDLSSRQHTLAKVPVLGFGAAAPLVPAIRSLVDVHPALLRLTTSSRPRGSEGSASAGSPSPSAAARSR